MLNKECLRVIKELSKRYARRPQDADDIFQETMILILKNPPKIEENFYPFNLLQKITKRGKFKVYYNTSRKGYPARDQESYVEYNFLEEYLDEFSLEKYVSRKQISGMMNKINGLANQEMALLNKIQEGYDPVQKDRTILYRLTKKLIERFK